MPNQTQKRQIYFPDGARVSAQTSPGGNWFDVGAIISTVSNTIEYDENSVELANARKTGTQIKNMRITGGFTLVNLENEGIALMGGGLFNRTVIDGTPSTTVDDQVIANGWVASADIPIVLVDSGISLKASTVPTITSVTGSVAGALAADDDYFIKLDSNSPSGYSIFLNTAGTAGVATTEDVTIVYTSVTPIASDVLTAGTSTLVLNAYALKIEHYTSAGTVDRGITLFSVNAQSGGFQFNFKGANEDGIEEMPITYEADLDDTRTDGSQLVEVFTAA